MPDPSTIFLYNQPFW